MNFLHHQRKKQDKTIEIHGIINSQLLTEANFIEDKLSKIKNNVQRFSQRSICYLRIINQYL